MRSFKFILTLVLGLSFITSFAQYQVKYSPVSTNYPKSPGFFSHILGSNSKYVYILFQKSTLFGSSYNITRQVVRMFDVKTMKLVKEVEIFDKKKINKDPNKNKVSSLKFYNCEVKDDKIYMIFTRNAGKKDREIWGKTYDLEFKGQSNFTKLMVYDRKNADFNITMNEKYDNIVFTTAPESVEKGEQLTLEYKVLDKDFKMVAANKVKLPVTSTRKRQAYDGYFKVDQFGNIYTVSDVLTESSSNTDKTEKKGKKDKKELIEIIN